MRIKVPVNKDTLLLYLLAQNMNISFLALYILYRRYKKDVFFILYLLGDMTVKFPSYKYILMQQKKIIQHLDKPQEISSKLEKELIDGNIIIEVPNVENIEQDND